MNIESFHRSLKTPLGNAVCLAVAVWTLALGHGGLLQSQQATSTAAAASTASTASTELPPSPEAFSTEQLEQLIAPIALHPDSLLVQILMAATYPVEVVQAERWVKDNDTLEGDALDEALKEEDWDASVKSLCKLPDVLEMMSENLDWTQDLGDAFLGQKDELLDTAQRMRGKAYDAGNLKTTEEIVVTVKQEPAEEKIIVIESPTPEIVYVPSYSPTVVYGSAWSYPSYYYPPLYYPPAYGYGLMTFGFGMVMGAAIWGGVGWGWGRNNVNINVNRYNNFNRNTNINPNRSNLSGNSQSWQHDASHRKGANYQNSKVAGQYGAGGSSNRVAQDQARGRSGSGTGATAGTRQARTPSATQNRAGGTAGTRPSATGQSAGTRSPVSGQGSGAGNRSATSARPSSAGSSAASSRSSSTTSRSSSAYSGSSSRSSAYSGSSRPSTDRMSSSRGSASRGSYSYGGGASRGGGMSRGGGGRRR